MDFSWTARVQGHTVCDSLSLAGERRRLPEWQTDCIGALIIPFSRAVKDVTAPSNNRRPPITRLALAAPPPPPPPPPAGLQRTRRSRRWFLGPSAGSAPAPLLTSHSADSEKSWPGAAMGARTPNTHTRRAVT